MVFFLEILTIFYRKDGRFYEGSWLADKKHGQGKFVGTDGKVTEGYWDEDRPPNMKKIKFLFKINDKTKSMPSEVYGVDFPKKKFTDAVGELFG